MGKKKSVAVLTLLTIVIVALCVFTMAPYFGTFLWKGAMSKWNPVVKTYDFDGTLGGGYYTYYYPEGVISETEYKIECEARAEDAEDLEEYKSSYKQYGGLYLSTDTDDGVLDEEGNVTETFKESFSAAAAEIAARYEKRGYSSYRVSVSDDYAIKVELPVSDGAASASIAYFAETGAFTLSDGTNTLKSFDEDDPATDYFKSFSVKTSNGTTYIEAKLTSAGRTLIKEQTTDLASSGGTLAFNVGETTVISLSVSEAIDQKTLYISGSGITGDSANTMAILLNSALNVGDLELSFTVDETRSYGGAADNNATPALTTAVKLLYVALGILLVASLILPIVRYRGYGGAMLYSTLSYLVVTALCFAFITSGVFEFTLGSVAVFAFGLLLTLFMNARVYSAIKADFSTGKTVESAVKAGYKKTLAETIDVYAVLILAALALLIGVGGVYTLALQALICLVTGAFCNLLWTRFINFALLSACKDKYKYFRFVREDDDDE